MCILYLKQRLMHGLLMLYQLIVVLLKGTDIQVLQFLSIHEEMQHVT